MDGNGRGGCCVAQYGGGGSGGVYDLSMMSPILQRYRPIAPKPVTDGGGAVSVGSLTPVKVIKSGKGKRKYAGGESTSTGSESCGSNSSNKRCNKRKKTSLSPVMKKTVITFPLLPEETPVRKEMPVRNSLSNIDLDLRKITSQNYAPSPIWLNVNDNFLINNPTVVVPQAVKIFGSSVTVECISDTWIVYGNDIGSTDEEKVMNLEKDTCPGFISDGENTVTWTNKGYRSMVGGTSTTEGEKKIAVWLLMKEKESEAVKKYETFTCRVKMQYTCKKERCSITLPCDVWKMESGGFAWRLDVKAALCLGR